MYICPDGVSFYCFLSGFHFSLIVSTLCCIKIPSLYLHLLYILLFLLHFPLLGTKTFLGPFSFSDFFLLLLVPRSKFSFSPWVHKSNVK